MAIPKGWMKIPELLHLISNPGEHVWVLLCVFKVNPFYMAISIDINFPNYRQWWCYLNSGYMLAALD